jgi:hypothetical protein
MRGHRWVVVAMVVAGCGSQPTEAADPPVPTPSRETASEPAPAVAPPAGTPPSSEMLASRAQAQALPFRWFESVPPNGVPSAFGAVGTGPRLDDHAVTDPGVYVAELDGALVHRAEAGAERWRVPGVAPFRAMPVLAMHVAADGARTVLVTGLSDDGWRMEARDGADGAMRWSVGGSLREATGALPTPAIQVGVVAELAGIHLRSQEADRTLWIRVADGQPAAENHVAREASRIGREPPPDAIGPRALPEGARVRCTAAMPAECTLERPGAMPVRWTSHAPRACRTHVVVADGDDVIIADHCFNGTGVEIHGATASTGALRFSTRPYGVGDIDHSRWSNEVRVQVTDRWIRVWGLESGLRYVSTLDRATGRELATITGR